MAGYIIMQHDDVNSGNEVFFNVTSANFSWKNLKNTNPVPGRWDIVETDVGGFENPIIVINGTSDLGDTTAVDVDGDSVNETAMTIPLLMDFAQVKFTGNNPIKLTIASGGDGTTNVFMKGRPSAGYSVGGTYRDFMYVTIDSFNYDIPSEYVDQRRLNFSINCTETLKRDEDIS